MDDCSEFAALDLHSTDNNLTGSYVTTELQRQVRQCELILVSHVHRYSDGNDIALVPLTDFLFKPLSSLWPGYKAI